MMAADRLAASLAVTVQHGDDQACLELVGLGPHEPLVLLIDK